MPREGRAWIGAGGWSLGGALSFALALAGCNQLSAAPPPATGLTASSLVSSEAVDAGPNLAVEGSIASDFTARDIHGRDVRLADYLGRRAVLIDFWVTSCEPCVAEMPHIRKIYNRHKAKGFVVIAVSMDGLDAAQDVLAFVKRNEMTFPVLVDTDSHIAAMYNRARTAPVSILIDKTGHVVNVREGYTPGDEKFVEDDIERALE